MPGLNALFYPQIVCLDEGVLRYLLLLYDKIFFLPNDIKLRTGNDSIASRFSINDSLLFSAFGSKEETYYSFMYGSEEKVWDDRLRKIIETYSELEDLGVCIAIKDEDFEDPNSLHPLKGAVDSDVADGRFLKHCQKAINRKYHVPPLAKEGAMKGLGLMTRPYEYQGDRAFASICSQRLNTMLYYAGLENLVPTSNSDLFTRLLGLKLRMALENPALYEERKLAGPDQRARLSLLSWEVMTEVVPRHLLIRKKVGQILKYKQESEDLQEKFRTRLSRLALEINEEPWGDQLTNKINKLVQLEILPEVERIREKKKVIWEKLFNEMLKGVLKPKVMYPLLSIFLIPNISYSDLITYGLSGGAATGYLGGLASKLIDLRQEEKELNRNALFFLLNIK